MRLPKAGWASKLWTYRKLSFLMKPGTGARRLSRYRLFVFRIAGPLPRLQVFLAAWLCRGKYGSIAHTAVRFLPCLAIQHVAENAPVKALAALRAAKTRLAKNMTRRKSTVLSLPTRILVVPQKALLNGSQDSKSYGNDCSPLVVQAAASQPPRADAPPSRT